MADHITDVFWITSADFNTVHYISPGYEKIWGRSMASLYAHPHQWSEAILPEDRERAFAALARVRENQPEVRVEYRIGRPDGEIRWIQDRAFQVRDEEGKLIQITGIATDITKRKQAEAVAQEFSERLKIATRTAHIGIWDWDIVNNKQIWDDTICELYGMPPGSFDGGVEDWREHLHPDDRNRVDKDLQAALRGECEYAPEFRVIWSDGSIHDIKANSQAFFDGNGKPLRMVGTNFDITERKQAAEKIAEYLTKLKSALMSTIDMATRLSELRDPYTTGHGRKVGQLAADIGIELGLDAERAEGLLVSGCLHDIGKITIPVELLSKPGKLTEIEYQLIQEHTRAGYEVLKNVQSPWPLAEVALQHHERIDGSGYPQGLKGDEILLEARIMAVADVLETMATHRPYRASLGIEAALAEIESGSASKYDPVVVQACLKLFREKGYVLPAVRQ